jgi:hypothetical protein
VGSFTVISDIPILNHYRDGQDQNQAETPTLH